MSVTRGHPDCRPSPAVVIEGLEFAYPGGRPVLSGIALEIPSGDVVGLVGPSGAGKSTLLQHLNGLLPARLPRGVDATVAVRIENLPVTHENRAEVRRRVGLMFQDPDDQLFCPTVREDVAFGPLNMNLPREVVRQRVDDSLSAVGLLELADRSVLQLSDGERKRVCLAGVLACQPSIIALDEPSANLDPRNRRTLIKLLASFAGTKLIATHDLDLVTELCERVVVLDGGRIQADGPTAEVLGDSLLMEQHGLEVPLRLQLARLDADIR